MNRVFRSAVLVTLAFLPFRVAAWGDEGHKIVGEIATHFLQPTVRQKIYTMLAADTDPLTPHDFVSSTTWADRFRDSDRSGSQVHFLQTRQWHFTDIEITDGNEDSACFGHPAVPHGTPASEGPPADCAADKVEQFASELGSPLTSNAERLVALKFLMHFVGDIHQPLHSSDDHDAGGNAKRASATGLGSGTLHGFWDTQLVGKLGVDPIAIGDSLASRITATQAAAWSSGTPTAWATEAFDVARVSVYGKLPRPSASGIYVLPVSYITASKPIITRQLSVAGVRLAAILNAALKTS